MEWGLQRISSRELTEWRALLSVEYEEAEHQRDVASEADGIVREYGKDTDEDDPDPDGDE